jgi:7-cyano-7-deazaguanine synthase
VKQYLSALRKALLEELHILELPVGDLYPQHWSITGEGIPDGDSADEAVFLPGRNVLLLSKAMVWCHLNDVDAVACGSLGSNPFPDATPAFFTGLQEVVNWAMKGAVQIYLPYTGMNKREVMVRGQGLPLELTFSCIHPVNGMHCGRCNKCAERRRAFAEAEMPDPTRYDG